MTVRKAAPGPFSYSMLYLLNKSDFLMGEMEILLLEDYEECEIWRPHLVHMLKH